jgi:hypothetical protein
MHLHSPFPGRACLCLWPAHARQPGIAKSMHMDLSTSTVMFHVTPKTQKLNGFYVH